MLIFIFNLNIIISSSSIYTRIIQIPYIMYTYNYY